MEDKQLQQLLLLSGFINRVAPVNLAKGKSINLAQVSSYEIAETIVDDKPTGKAAPIITMQSGEQIELTTEENQVFRNVWNAYTEATATVIELLQSLLAYNRGETMPAENNEKV